MKILVYGLNYAPELIGVAKYTHEMCEWLANRGHEVKVVTSYPYYPDWKVSPPYRAGRYLRERLNGVDIVRCPVYVPTNPSGLRRLLHHLSFAASSAPAITGLALKFRPDVLFAIAPSQLVAPVAVAASRLSGAQSWLHIQDFEIESAFELGILSGSRLRRSAESIERNIIRRFDRVSTISPKMLERLASKQVPSSRLIEFRNWVDTSVIFPQDRMVSLRAELGLSSNSVVALYSGTMALKQGFETLIEAARIVRGSKPEIVFVFCGQGATRNRLMELSHHLDNIKFLDLQPKHRLSELLSLADIHLLPQRAEVADLVLPSKLAPMLASGRPIITMAKPGTQLAIEVHGSGLVIPADDPPALVAALVRLADDLTIREKLGHSGRAAAQSRWDIQLILGRLEENLVALAEQRQPVAASLGRAKRLEEPACSMGNVDSERVHRYTSKS